MSVSSSLSRPSSQISFLQCVAELQPGSSQSTRSLPLSSTWLVQFSGWQTRRSLQSSSLAQSVSLGRQATCVSQSGSAQFSNVSPSSSPAAVQSSGLRHSACVLQSGSSQSFSRSSSSSAPLPQISCFTGLQCSSAAQSSSAQSAFESPSSSASLSQTSATLHSGAPKQSGSWQSFLPSASSSRLFAHCSFGGASSLPQVRTTAATAARVSRGRSRFAMSNSEKGAAKRPGNERLAAEWARGLTRRRPGHEQRPS